MLVKIYIEALLVDDDLADQVQVLLESGLISGTVHAFTPWLIAFGAGNDSATAIGTAASNPL